MPPNRFVEMFTRGGRRGRTADDDEGDASRRATAGLRSDESTPATTRRPASAIAHHPPSLTSSRVALISCDGTADGSGAAPERSDAEMGLTTGFTPRRRLPSADDRRRRAGSAGVELGGSGGIGKRGGDLSGGEHKAPPGNSQQQHQQQRHATFLPLPPLPIRLRRRTSTAHGGGGSSTGVNTPRALSRRDTNGEDENDDDSSPSTSSSHSTLAVDATAADVPPANPAPPKPPSLLRAVAQWWRVAILWFKSKSVCFFSFFWWRERKKEQEEEEKLTLSLDLDLEKKQKKPKTFLPSPSNYQAPPAGAPSPGLARPSASRWASR